MNIETTIKQSNILTSARYDYSSYEINLLMLLCKAVNANQKRQEFYTISINEFIDKSELSKGSLHYIKNASAKLRSKSLEFYDKETNTYIITGIVDLIEMPGNSDILKLYVNSRMYPLLNEFKKEFTTIDINAIFRLKRKHSKRFYQFFRQFVNTGIFSISLEDLKKRLQLDKGYEKFSHFNSRVLMPAVKEINQYTSMNVTYEIIKRGRAVDSLRFHLVLPPGQLDLIERENDSVSNRLDKFNFSPWFVLNIINTCTPEQIHQTCYAIELRKSEKGIANLGAYAYTAFCNIGVPHTRVNWTN
jgi:plasmid replication initiation protein